MTNRQALLVFVGETVAVFCVARYFGADFVQACQCTTIVNAGLTISFLIALVRERQ